MKYTAWDEKSVLPPKFRAKKAPSLTHITLLTVGF